LTGIPGFAAGAPNGYDVRLRRAGTGLRKDIEMTMRMIVLLLAMAIVMIGCEESKVSEETLPATPAGHPDPGVEVVESTPVGTPECGAEKPTCQASAKVTGRVMYRQRIALPDNAIVKVQLQDVSLQDVAAKVLSEQIIETQGKQVPIPFELPYDPEEIDERHTYSISVRITIDGKLKFINTTSRRVLTRGAPADLDVMVEMVGR
jgi:putative lipoprotein